MSTYIAQSTNNSLTQINIQHAKQGSNLAYQTQRKQELNKVIETFCISTLSGAGIIFFKM